MKWRSLFSVVCAVPTAAWAMADATPPVYGIPTLYGEYEIGADEMERIRGMYGDAPARRAAPIKATDARHANAAKQPVMAKKTAPKKKTKQSPKAKKKSAERSAAVVQQVAPAAPKANPAQPPVLKVEVVADTLPPPPTAIAEPSKTAPAPKAPQPDAHAAGIADALGRRMDADSYCTIRARAPSGAMPDGFVLMPGRPDLMSCGEK